MPVSTDSMKVEVDLSRYIPDERRLQVIRLWEVMNEAAIGYVKANKYTAISGMPHIASASAACEDFNSVFKLDACEYFGRSAFLCQSNQLLLEPFTKHFNRVWTYIHSFRKELVADNRRLAEFPLFEIEILGGFEDLLVELEGLLKAICTAAVDSGLLEYFGRDVEAVRNIELARLSYSDAIPLLQEAGFPIEWGDDLGAEHEAFCADKYGPLFLHSYPTPVKFFQMELYEDNPGIVKSADIVLPFSGESTGAAERDTDAARVRERLYESSMYKKLLSQGAQPEDFEWYLQMLEAEHFPQHSGAGIGMARVAQFLMGSNDIRECVPFLTNCENLL